MAVMMVYDKPPFAIAGRKSLGVTTPSDLEGKILGCTATRWCMGTIPTIRFCK